MKNLLIQCLLLLCVLVANAQRQGEPLNVDSLPKLERHEAPIILYRTYGLVGGWTSSEMYDTYGFDWSPTEASPLRLLVTLSFDKKTKQCVKYVLHSNMSNHYALAKELDEEFDKFLTPKVEGVGKTYDSRTGMYYYLSYGTQDGYPSVNLIVTWDDSLTNYYQEKLNLHFSLNLKQIYYYSLDKKEWIPEKGVAVTSFFEVNDKIAKYSGKDQNLSFLVSSWSLDNTSADASMVLTIKATSESGLEYTIKIDTNQGTVKILPSRFTDKGLMMILYKIKDF